MRAAYLLWADDAHIDRLIKSGINTLLIPDYNTPPVPVETPEMPSHARTLDIIGRFKHRALLLLVPVWFQNWFDLPDDQQFTDKQSKRWKRTPCPTSVAYFEKRFDVPLDLYHNNKIDGVVWDIENYAAPGVVDFYNKGLMPTCYCDRCNEIVKDNGNLYQAHRELWHRYMEEFKVKGVTPYSRPWVLDLFPLDTMWFSQTTYEEADWWKLFKIMARWNGQEPKSIGGAWLEKHKDKEVVAYAQSLVGTALPVDFTGYWFYTHSRLTKEDKPCPGPYCGPMQDVFFDDLKKVSGGEQMVCRYKEQIDLELKKCRENIFKILDGCDCSEPSLGGCHPEYEGRGDHPDFPDDKPTEGEKFDHHWYLSKYKDVAENDCYKDKPFAHYYHHGKAEGRKPYPETNDGFTMFVPAGQPSLLFEGGDNGIVTVDRFDHVYMAEGDVFVNINKYETAFFVCHNGKNPMDKKAWQFYRGTRGKTYGLVSFQGDLLSLQSDKGSGFEGTQNARFFNVATGWRSNNTLQKMINPLGVNWFFVQLGRENEFMPDPDEVMIGCLTYRIKGDRDFHTPITLFKGDPYHLKSFRKVGECEGLIGPRSGHATTCSITYVKEHDKYVATLGDWSQSIVHQFIADKLLGPYRETRSDLFKPPMKRHKINDKPAGYSGVFTSTFFKRSGQWYEVLSGHRDADDDNTWIRKVVAK